MDTNIRNAQRAQLRARRRREVRIARIKALAVLAIIIVSLAILLGSGIKAFGSVEDSRPYNKYYTSITVESGDTLWTIADEYIGGASVDKEDYIDEICTLNNLSDGHITAGSNIIIAYYSQELK